jgi:hypothetical protein
MVQTPWQAQDWPINSSGKSEACSRKQISAFRVAVMTSVAEFADTDTPETEPVVPGNHHC